MDKFSIYVPRLLPKIEHFTTGWRSCKGCGKALSLRLIAKALEEKGLMYHYPLPKRAIDKLWRIENLLSSLNAGNRAELLRNFMSALGTMQGKHEKKVVISISKQLFMNDAPILINSENLSHGCLYICIDNEPEIDDLIRRASPQQFNLPENKSVDLKEELKQTLHRKHIASLHNHEHFQYLATACPAYPFDLLEKVKRGIECSGNAFILVLTPCPTGWVFHPSLTIKVGFLAVQTGYFPLAERINGHIDLTVKIHKRKPIKEYLKMQKRFLTFPVELFHTMQNTVDSLNESLKTQIRTENDTQQQTGY